MKPVKAWAVVRKCDGVMDEEQFRPEIRLNKEVVRIILNQFYEPEYWRIARVEIREIKKKK